MDTDRDYKRAFPQRVLQIKLFGVGTEDITGDPRSGPGVGIWTVR